jgi:AcrR family transcriptional regulator
MVAATGDSTAGRSAKPRTPSRARATAPSSRDLLLRAAAEEFAERGYDGARVSSIARRAGLTTGAIYANFTGKAELLLASIESRGPDQLDALLVDGLEHDPGPDLLATLGAALSTRSVGTSRALVFEAIGGARRDPHVAELLREHFDASARHLADYAKQGHDEGWLDDAVDTEALVRLCLALALGSLSCDVLGLPVPDPERWRGLVERLADSLVPAPPPTAVPRPPGATPDEPTPAPARTTPRRRANRGPA